jgi:hypothetical protein
MVANRASGLTLPKVTIVVARVCGIKAYLRRKKMRYDLMPAPR